MTHGDVHGSHALDLSVDGIAGLKETTIMHFSRAGRRTSEENVTWLDGDIVTDDAQLLVDFVYHLRGIGIHHLLIVDEELNLKCVRIGNELLWHDIWATWCHRILRLAPDEIDAKRCIVLHQAALHNLRQVLRPDDIADALVSY
jgi:hypothetical protein